MKLGYFESWRHTRCLEKVLLALSVTLSTQKAPLSLPCDFDGKNSSRVCRKVHGMGRAGGISQEVVLYFGSGELGR